MKDFNKLRNTLKKKSKGMKAIINAIECLIRINENELTMNRKDFREFIELEEIKFEKYIKIV